jgi:GntR family transcriptional repressor for pyruvate dehydrogenase complex
MKNLAEEAAGHVPAEKPIFEFVQQRRSYQEIYDQVRREIAAGRLVPGDRLPAEREMSTMFGVNRQAVREALRALEVSGLIKSKVGVAGGSFVEPGDPGVVIRGLNDLAVLGQLSSGSLLEARILMTSDAIRLACKRGLDEDFMRLEKDIDETERLTQQHDLERRSTQIVNFYRLLGEATHNEVYGLLIDSLTAIVQVRLSAAGPDPRTDVVTVRRSILSHMRSRNEEAAVREMVDHLQRLEVHLLEKEKSPSSNRTRNK